MIAQRLMERRVFYQIAKPKEFVFKDTHVFYRFVGDKEEIDSKVEWCHL